MNRRLSKTPPWCGRRTRDVLYLNRRGSELYVVVSRLSEGNSASTYRDVGRRRDLQVHVEILDLLFTCECEPFFLQIDERLVKCFLVKGEAAGGIVQGLVQIPDVEIVDFLYDRDVVV